MSRESVPSTCGCTEMGMVCGASAGAGGLCSFCANGGCWDPDDPRREPSAPGSQDGGT
jgi:hypothetical protein